MLSTLFTNPGLFFYNLLLYLPGIIIALSFHEFAHAWMSDRLGDPTPRSQGRVTISPLAHIDPIGLAMIAFLGFGYGKPVIINSAHYKHRKRDERLVALAGVTMNFFLACFFSLVLGLLYRYRVTSEVLLTIVEYCITINLSLMVFNLLPIPPLDGYKVLRSFTLHLNPNFFWQAEQYGYWVLLFLLATGALGPLLVALRAPLLDLMTAIARLVF